MAIKMRYYSEDKNKIAPELKKLKNKSYPDFINALIDLCDDPKALNMIKQYFGGPKGENLLDAKKTLLPASKLMPTQNEIDLDKSLKYGLTHPENIKNYFSKEVEIKTPIVTYNGSYIIDGHHRWSQIYIFNPKAKLVCINFEGELSPIQVLKSTQGSIAADISKVPVSKVEGTSMYDVDEDTIRKYITSYISDGSVEELKKYVKSVKSKDDAIEYLVNNSMHLIANNTPIAHAPKRDFMPQTDQASGALNKLDKSTTVFSRNGESREFSDSISKDQLLNLSSSDTNKFKTAMNSLVSYANGLNEATFDEAVRKVDRKVDSTLKSIFGKLPDPLLVLTYLHKGMHIDWWSLEDLGYTTEDGLDDVYYELAHRAVEDTHKF